MRLPEASNAADALSASPENSRSCLLASATSTRRYVRIVLSAMLLPPSKGARSQIEEPPPARPRGVDTGGPRAGEVEVVEGVTQPCCLGPCGSEVVEGEPWGRVLPAVHRLWEAQLISERRYCVR